MSIDKECKTFHLNSKIPTSHSSVCRTTNRTKESSSGIPFYSLNREDLILFLIQVFPHVIIIRFLVSTDFISRKMPAENSTRRRKPSRSAPDLSAFSEKSAFIVNGEIKPSWWQRRKIEHRRFTVNILSHIQDFLEDHPGINQLFQWVLIIVFVAVVVIYIFFPPTLQPRFKTLSPWHVKVHNAWLKDHRIHETTWILDEKATEHTSNDPYLVNDVMLQFPQSSGGAAFFMKDVKFDPEAHYGVISMKKLEAQSHVPMRLLFGLGEGTRPVMGVELVGRDVVAIAWGDGGTYLLKAWTLKKCEWPFLRDLCLWYDATILDGATEISSETMRALVDKHRTPAAAIEEDLKQAATPWQQRTLEEIERIAQEKKKKWGFWGSSKSNGS